jgi:3-(3-hydroxy-phenyl)propionate hydroxylase
MDDRAIQKRLEGLVGDLPYTLMNKSIYSVHQRVAETFRVGRVMLLGDAAHINNPAGGMGMNSGIHDAHNLANKLTRIICQQEGEHLLDLYASQRRNWAVDKVQHHTHETYATMVIQDEVARAQRNAQYRSWAQDSVKAREYLLRASMLDDRIRH